MVSVLVIHRWLTHTLKLSGLQLPAFYLPRILVRGLGSAGLARAHSWDCIQRAGHLAAELSWDAGIAGHLCPCGLRASLLFPANSPLWSLPVLLTEHDGTSCIEAWDPKGTKAVACRHW